jgi:hypothetical protein
MSSIMCYKLDKYCLNVAYNIHFIHFLLFLYNILYISDSSKIEQTYKLTWILRVGQLILCSPSTLWHLGQYVSCTHFGYVQ